MNAAAKKTSSTMDPLALRTLRRLVPGKHGTQQPFAVRRRLQQFQNAGLIAYDDGEGWTLTDAGRAAAGGGT